MTHRFGHSETIERFWVSLHGWPALDLRKEVYKTSLEYCVVLELKQLKEK